MLLPPTQTCCPQYTIRLPVRAFKPSKSQRNCLRKFDSRLQKGTAFGPLPADSDLSAAAPNVLTVETVPAACTDETFALYKAYQVAVHGDKPEELTKEKFSDFLVASSLPLQPVGSSDSAHPLGTHHQLYRIDGRLVAVGVLDFLPHSLSSVYCFYDPDLKHLGLGKYSAMREIQYCIDINVPYYCMGFYIHNCAKMNYKGDYAPSELLCPTTLKWFPTSECRTLLDAFNFSPLDPSLATSRSDIGDGLYFPAPKRKRVASGDDAGEDEEALSPAERTARSDHASKMAAMFGPRLADPDAVDAAALVLTGTAQDLYLWQLRETYQKMLRPILTDWVTFAGTDVARRMGVKIG